MTQDRFRGALIGLAIGDAIGAPNEFKRRGSFEPLTGMVGGGPFRLKPGEWTDDTAMALCLADSLIEHQGFNAADQMNRYVRWWREGYNSVNGQCFDIGTTTAGALALYIEQKNPFAGDPSPSKAGNGSLMRLSPVIIFFASNVEEAIQYAGESSRTTHAAPQAVDSCRYYAQLVVRAFHAEPKEVVLRAVTGPFHPEVQAIADGKYLGKSIDEVHAHGYVVKTLEAALWCFARSQSFGEGCLMAANLGDDSDTVAAIYGQIAGAFYGESGIPADWLNQLAWRDHIRGLADRLSARHIH